MQASMYSSKFEGQMNNKLKTLTIVYSNDLWNKTIKVWYKFIFQAPIL